MQIINKVSLLLILSLSILSIRGFKFTSKDIYNNPKEVRIIKYINSNDYEKKFVLESDEVKDTIGILYSRFYPANNDRPTINNPRNWTINLYVKDGKGKRSIINYSPNDILIFSPYNKILTRQIENINMWLTQIDINKMISENKLSYFSDQNIYGLTIFYYLIPEK